MKESDSDRGVVLAELAAVNIKPLKVELTGRSHWRIVWQACPEKAPREIIVAGTPSDWRSRLNTRAQVRRLLRADNVSLAEVVKKPKTTFAKAMSVPTETPSLLDEIRLLRSEISELTLLVLEQRGV